jgi:hypothetical protein
MHQVCSGLTPGTIGVTVVLHAGGSRGTHGGCRVLLFEYMYTREYTFARLLVMVVTASDPEESWSPPAVSRPRTVQARKASIYSSLTLGKGRVASGGTCNY